MLLRKPPPPASSSGVRLPPTTMPNVVINTDALKMKSNKDVDGDSGAHHTVSSCVSSVAAVAETTNLEILIQMTNGVILRVLRLRNRTNGNNNATKVSFTP